MESWLVTLIILTVLLALAAVFFFIFRSNANKLDESLRLKDEYEDNYKTATPAVAKITSIIRTNAMNNANNTMRLDIRFEVMPSCAQPYHAVSSWLVDGVSVPMVQPGEIVQVRIDAEDNNKIYPAVTWAKYWFYN